MKRTLLTIAVLTLAYVAISALSVHHFASVQHHVSSHSSHVRIAEDDPRWNCETMGDHVCGSVNVETYREGSHTFVRVWDEHNRLVFGPSYVEGFER